MRSPGSAAPGSQIREKVSLNNVRVAIPIGPLREQIEIAGGSEASFGEDVNADPGAIELFDHAAGDIGLRLEGLVRVAGEAEEDARKLGSYWPLTFSGEPLYLAIEDPLVYRADPGDSECFRFDVGGIGNIAVGAAVGTAGIEIERQLSIFECLSFRFIDVHFRDSF
jgi:hypothetical protein